MVELKPVVRRAFVWKTGIDPKVNVRVVRDLSRRNRFIRWLRSRRHTKESKCSS